MVNVRKVIVCVIVSVCEGGYDQKKWNYYIVVIIISSILIIIIVVALLLLHDCTYLRTTILQLYYCFENCYMEQNQVNT